MKINSNINAHIAANALSKNQRVMGNAMERLSTGVRINSARDDAAGLAITSKMTSQINGLKQAVRNTNDAISMLQVAEGATVEITNMLQRMRELAVQAANGSNTANDRQALDKEFQHLSAEIDRISKNTQWNGKNLLDGTGFANGTANFQIGANADQIITTELADLTKVVSSTVTTPKRIGEIIKPNVTVRSVYHENQPQHAIESLSTGGFASIWTELTSSSPEGYVLRGQIYDSFGQATGDIIDISDVPTLTSSEASARVMVPSITALENGEFVVTWIDIDNQRTVGQRFSSSGEYVGSHFIIRGPDSNPAKLYNSGTRVASVKGGGFVAVGSDQSARVIYLSRFDHNGSLLEQQIDLNAHDLRGPPSVAASLDGGFVVVANSLNQGNLGNLALLRFDANGNALGDPIRVNTAAIDGDKWASHHVERLSDGGYVVGYNKAFGEPKAFLFRKFDASGNAIGGEVQIENGLVGTSTISAMEDGGFIVAWANGDYVNHYPNTGQRFDQFGNAIGDRFEMGTDNASLPSITTLRDGTFVLQSILGHENPTGPLNIARYSIKPVISSVENASAALSELTQSISTINSQRSSYGATINRLEYAADNLTNIAQNTEAARSRILDTDYASETTELARTQIIQQAATAMLTQANQQAKYVLELLKSV